VLHVLMLAVQAQVAPAAIPGGGEVRDAVTRAPLAGVLVHVVGTADSTRTSPDGRWSLAAVVNGLLWLVDFKGTGKGYGDNLPKWNPAGEFAVKWQFHLQLLVVRAALMRQAINEGSGPPVEVGGVVVERFKRSPPFAVDPNPAPFNEPMHHDAVATVRAQVIAETAAVEEVVAAQKRGEDMETWLPTGNLWSCYEGGSPCDYRPLCMTDRKDIGAFRAVLASEYKSADEA
jgi:hypothetical protein